MGSFGFDEIFSTLDPARRGYLTSDDIQTVQETLYFTKISEEHLTAAVSQVCGKGSDGKVNRSKFVPLLEELERRRSLEDKLRWDFLALDHQGTCTISIQNALLLFKNTHDVRFSMQAWHKFLSSRYAAEADVIFDELKMWLINPIEGATSSEADYQREMDRLNGKIHENNEIQFTDYINFQNDDLFLMSIAQEREDYWDKTRNLARRKKNKWDKQGLEGLLFDDGTGHYDVDVNVSRQGVTVNDLLDALSDKYELLRRKLIWYMVKEYFGELPTSPNSDEQLELFTQLQLEERQLRKEGALKARVMQLTGADIMYEFTVNATLGELPEAHKMRVDEANKRRLKLSADRKSDREIDQMLQSEYMQFTQGTTKCGNLLALLNERYEAERSWLMEQTRGHGFRGHGFSEEKVSLIDTMFCVLNRQLVQSEAEVTFTPGALAMGLAERPQEFGSERFNFDRSRQEQLAAYRLERRKGRNIKIIPEHGGSVKDKRSKIELQLDITKEICRKHAYEREVLIHMLQGRDSNASRSAARQLTPEQREDRLSTLRNQRSNWRDGTSDYMASQRHLHLKIMQEGVGLYLEKQRCVKEKLQPNVTDEVMNVSVLAELQQKQDEEAGAVLQRFSAMLVKELEGLYQRELRAKQEEHLDNVAAVVLGSFECTEEEALYIAALEEKYEALRDVLFLQVLQLEHRATWTRLSMQDQQRMLVKLKNEEKKLRHDGRLDDMSKLLSTLPKGMGSLRKWMGENRAEYSKRVSMVTEDKEQDEQEISSARQSNFLAELLHRFYEEQDALILWLRSPDTQKLSDRECQLQLLQLHREGRIGGDEESFDAAGIMVGFAERWQAALEMRHRTDRQRHELLAQIRFEQRVRRVQLGVPFKREPDAVARPHAGDILAWMEACVKEMDKKHVEEREMLLSILQDPGIEELRQAATLMPSGDQQKRLAELQAKRRFMDMDDPEQREENISILEEAAAIRSLCKKMTMNQSNPQKEITNDDVTVAILTELQNLQDRETAILLTKITKMDEDWLKKFREEQINDRKWGAAENVVAVLTMYEGVAEDQQILKALEEKYDALRDKLLMEALMKQHSEDEWRRMSQQEKEKKLAHLRMMEKRLRREQKYDEIERLLGDLNNATENLNKLMGEKRADYERRIKERLEKRKQREEQGLPPEDSDDEHDGIRESEEEVENAGKITRRNILQDLQFRFEEEREALMAMLKGMNDQYLSEKERQAALVRLRREKRKAEEEERFESAARLIGLAERQNALMKERLKGDKERQKKLALQRLEERRRKKGEKWQLNKSLQVLRQGDKLSLQDNALRLLDAQHEQERTALADLLMAPANEHFRLLASAASSQEIFDKLSDLKVKRANISPDKTAEHQSLLLEAVTYRRASIQLTYDPPEQPISDEEVAVRLMSELQQQQDVMAEAFIHSITEKSEEELLQAQMQIWTSIQQQTVDNVATVLLCPGTVPTSTETALLQALRGKYDTLNDRLLAEALIKQHGEAKWKIMSEEERQKKLAEMKIHQRRLKREGREAEAAALLEEALADKETVLKLLGDSKADQERKMKERLQRRKERSAEGMTDEEILQLEKEEDEREMEDYKKTRRNILLELENNYDKEREALLKSLEDQKNSIKREKLRQMELARLRREQIKAKQEDRFEAAAAVIRLAEEQDLAIKSQLDKQRELAKRRLTEKLEQRKKAANQIPQYIEIPGPSDTGDVIGWVESVIKEIELRHLTEREFLIQMMQDETGGNQHQSARKMSPEQRWQRLEELNELRKVIRGQTNSQQFAQDMQAIYKEAFSLKMETLLTETGGTVSEIHTTLLAELQQNQDEEGIRLTAHLQEKNVAALEQIKVTEAAARKQNWMDNTATVLFTTKSDDSEIIPEEDRPLHAALKQKYDVLHDKLLTEALRTQVGENEWLKMSSKERMQRLVEMRQAEKRLQREGKYEEALSLLGQAGHRHKGILGATPTQVRAQQKDQENRRQQMKKDRKKQGLSTDESVIDTLLEQQKLLTGSGQEENQKNILEELQLHFEDEKQNVSLAVEQAGEKNESEHARQMELARLRHQTKLLQQKEAFNNAAKLLRNFQREGTEQLDLSKERLAKYRQDRHEEVNKETVEKRLKMSEVENKKRDSVAVTMEQKDGRVALVESVLEEMELKHESERHVLLQLLQVAAQDKDSNMLAKHMAIGDLKFNLEKLRQDHSKWRARSCQLALENAAEDMSTSEHDHYIKNIASSQTDHFRQLTKATVYRLQVEKLTYKIKFSSLSDTEIQEQISIQLLAELQHKQMVEGASVQKVLLSQDENMLKNVKFAQRVSRREAWLDNLTNTIFTLAHDDTTTQQGAAPNIKVLEGDLQKEYELLKKEIEKKKSDGKDTEADINVELAEIEKEHAEKKRTIKEAVDRQKKANQEKLEKQRRAQEDAEYAEQVSEEMMKMALAYAEAVTDQSQGERNRQNEVMSQRLQARRESRKKAAEEAERKKRQGRRVSTTQKPKENVELPPGLGLSREKTVVDVSVTDDQKNELYNQLMREQMTRESKMTQQRQRASEMLDRRLQEKKGRRDHEIAGLLSESEREKSTLEETQRLERERQTASILERVDRRRQELKQNRVGSGSSVSSERRVTPTDSTEGATSKPVPQEKAKLPPDSERSQQTSKAGKVSRKSSKERQTSKVKGQTGTTRIKKDRSKSAKDRKK